MVAYDSSIISHFAEQLYAKAATIVFTYTVIGAVVGFGMGIFIGAGVVDRFPRGGLLPLLGAALLGAVVVGALAAMIGRQKAFALKLRAQVALCQAQIEENTRR